MKTIYLLRHSTKTATGNAPLSKEGVDLAHRVGQTILADIGFTNIFVSPLSRTVETLKAMKVGARNFPKGEKIFPLHDVSALPEGMALWEGVCHKAEDAGQDMLQAALTLEPDRARFIAEQAAEAFREWAAELEDDCQILVIHHSPFLELLVYGLFGTVLPQLHPCEGFKIIEDGGDLVFESLVK